MRATRVACRHSPKSVSGWTAPHLSPGLNRLGPPPSQDTTNHRREGEAWTTWFGRVAKNTFSEKSADDKVFGGDHRTAKADAMHELRMMDRRIQTYKHPELADNCLKCIVSLDAPNGDKLTPEYLEGRLVGVLMFGDTPRSEDFMPILERVQRRHNGDFVVVGISCRMNESHHLTKTHNFLHCTHRNGAAMVQRDLGFMISPFMPLPRLYIVDGTSGLCIGRSGYTAVMTNPDGCVNEWISGGPGHNWWDFPRTWIS